MTNPAGPPPALDQPELIAFREKLEAARKELLETSVRSRLLHTPLGSTRAKIIEVRDKAADDVFRILVRESRSMAFRAAVGRAPEPSQESLELAQPDDDDSANGESTSRDNDTKLQTGLQSSPLQTRLRGIAYDAQSFESEQGVNILYIALGFLKWFDPRDPNKPRFAPLLLIPVTLTRASARERFKLSYSGEELATNLSLRERLKDEGIELPNLPDTDDISPGAYAAATSRAVAGMPNWEVLPDAIALGFFSFAKLMMYRDLDPELWPLTSALEDHAVIRGLLGDGFRGDEVSVATDETAVDAVVDISTVGHVVDADSSQTLAIEDVRIGRNLVIQGPPGTGKSQTITNLIASAVREGKRVLFVAEKMAALNVVRSNLDRIGLGQICLELHSHKAKKKVVLEDLEQTYQWSEVAARGRLGIADDLRRSRDELNDHAERIHKPLVPSAFTPFEVFGKLARLAGKEVAAPDFAIPTAKDWSRAETEAHSRRLSHLADHVIKMGVPAAHPWRGTNVDVMLPQDVSRIAIRAGELSAALSGLSVEGRRVAAKIDADFECLGDFTKLAPLGEFAGRAPTVHITSIADAVWLQRQADITELVKQGAAYSRIRRDLQTVLLPDAWNQDWSDVKRLFIAHGRSWLRWTKADYRQAVGHFRRNHNGPAPKSVVDRIEILQRLATGQRSRKCVREGATLGAAAFASMWKGEESDWQALHAIDEWMRQASAFALSTTWRQQLARLEDLAVFASEVIGFATRLETLRAELQALCDSLALDVLGRFGQVATATVPISLLAEWLSTLATNAGRFQEWSSWRIWSKEGREAGLIEVVDRLADGRLPAEKAADVCECAHFEALARQVFAEQRDLALFDGRSHEHTVEDFKKLDREVLAFARREIQARHVEHMPRGGREVGEVGVLAREWHKQRRHLPLRQLVKAAGRAIQLIKPVWMMSPMSLAQFVEPGAVEFDLLLIDEASQVRPVEALGAIARAKQVVVVGDDKQLPPTAFFDRVAGEDSEPVEADDFIVSDVESILGLCTAQGIPDRMLRWHYRSQHESLIAVSNQEFYRKLFIVPSAQSEDLGLRFNKVKGIYDRGKTATNRVEALAVAKAVMEHARRYRSSARFPEGMSLGVGTFSVAQRDAILDELELFWRKEPELAAFFDSDTPEPFFVKNLESIQGDERDVVMISVGYGPDEGGYVTMGFGPLTLQGGERRLNVLISRARRRCEVFSSISAADIDLARTQSIGVRVFKTFLQYAETGHLDRSEESVRPIDSDFEEDVGMSLARLGYAVQHQVGVAGFFVDLAIKDPQQPGRYLIGIECDGATYHSSRSARDRDRLREQVLNDRGWRIHRIWSTDWFKRRDQELARAVAAIEAAKCTTPPQQRAEVEADDVADTLVAEDEATDVDEPPRVAELTSAGTAYREAEFQEHIATEPHLLGRTSLLQILVRIVEIEGPIHCEEVGRRYATVCGKDRAGNRIQDAVAQGLDFARQAGLLHADGQFYSVTATTFCTPRDRSNAQSITLRKPDMLPPVEIRTGLRGVVGDHVGVEPPAAVTAVARMFGFQRTGAELQRVIEEQVREMLGRGALSISNGNRLYLPK